jgi:hypothetical protein
MAEDIPVRAVIRDGVVGLAWGEKFYGIVSDDKWPRESNWPFVRFQIAPPDHDPPLLAAVKKVKEQAIEAMLFDVASRLRQAEVLLRKELGLDDA